MRDKYFDHQEITRYADHAAALVKGLLAMDPSLSRVVDGQEALAAQIRTNLAIVDGSAATLRDSADQRKGKHNHSKARLDRLHLHLKGAQQDGHAFQMDRFFKGGLKVGVEQSIADRLAAIEMARDGFLTYPTLPDAKAWQEELAALATDYTMGTEGYTVSSQDKVNAQKELKRLKKTWKRHYLASKRLVEGALLLAEREGEYKGCFLDLSQG